MSSNLRFQLDSTSTQSYFPQPSTLSSPAKKQKMSLTQTYRIASSARVKLGREAARGDHDLRLLVGHANLLDSLMVELANAEKEQEAWFNDHLRQAEKSPEAPKHIQWFDSIIEENEDDLSGSEGGEEEEEEDLDSDLDTESFPVVKAPRRRSVSPPPAVSSVFSAQDDWEDEDIEYDDEHALARIPSHTPDLIQDSDESDEEPMPPSPPDHPMQSEGGSEELTDYFQKVPTKLVSQHTVLIDDYSQTSHHGQMVAAA